MKYYASTSKKNLRYLSNKKVNNVKLDDDRITFEVNDKSLELLLNDITELSYFNKRKTKIIIFLKKYLISILCILILFVFIINEQFVIKKIVFINENTYNKEVVDYLYENYLEKKLFYYYLSDSINNVNSNIRHEFYYYEWINVNKRGNKLLVQIDKQDEKSYLDATSNVVGDIIANEDGIIRSYFIKKGVTLIKDNQSVKKGDILVSGNLLINNQMIDYIHPVGIVLAEVGKYDLIKIPKIEKEYIRTGNIKILNSYTFLKYKITPKISFEMYEQEEIKVIENKFFKKVKLIIYEIKELINYYDKDSSYKYAKSIIEKEFNDTKIHEQEKLLEIILLNNYEDNNHYYYKFFVKKIINISEFKAVNLEENNNL